MQISALRTEVSDRLRAFSWDQWSQMGVFASSGRQDRWAADPEALLLFTLEVGRDDARLFDEVLDWLVVNERLISVRRLRTLCRDDVDRALLEASLGWVARWRPRSRLIAKEGVRSPQDARPLFRSTRTTVRDPDEAFLVHGWLKPLTQPSRKSKTPDLRAPINFAFRLRHLLGVGVRAEVLRVLLTADAPRLTAQVVTESAGYAKRNVHEALTSLRAAGVIDAVSVANELRYGAPRDDWARLLGIAPGNLPHHQDWPQLLHALRRLIRWLKDERHQRLSEYMLASEARVLMDEIAPELRAAGVRAYAADGRGAEYWPQFVEIVQDAVRAIT